MNTASSSATKTSMKNQSTAELLPKFVAAAFLVVCAACTTLPQPTPPPPPASNVAPEPGPALLRPVAFQELPGWADDTLADAWPAFSASCTVLAVQPATAKIWHEPCAIATTIDPRDAVAVRAFFEQHFTAYRAVAPDGQETGLATGYYEP